MMSGYRTPETKNKTFDKGSSGASGPPAGEEDVPLRPQPNVRRSIGEWESGKLDSLLTISPPKKTSKAVGVPKSKQTTARRPSVETVGTPPKAQTSKTSDRVAEARAWVTKAKIQLSRSGNLKREIKDEVLAAIDRLYQLVKEADSAKKLAKQPEIESTPLLLSCDLVENKNRTDSKLETLIREHMDLIKENSVKMETLTESLNKTAPSQDQIKVQGEGLEKLLTEVRELRQTTESKSYASAAASVPKRNLPVQTALHSVVVSAKDELETSEQVLNRIRKTVNAKEGEIIVDKVRKAKDAKVIVTCRTVEERSRLKERLAKSKELIVEEVKNKDPLVILRDVFQYNSDEEVLKALKNQNKSLFTDLAKDEDRFEVAYKRRTRNPHTAHIVLRVSPKLWQAMVVAETVHIDLQRVRVADQSPLVQCSLCLGYGHGRRFCKETLEKCSHCGGPHLRAQCADWLANSPPSCCNCIQNKLDKTDHNAFSDECVIRKKWEGLARATVAYC